MPKPASEDMTEHILSEETAEQILEQLRCTIKGEASELDLRCQHIGSKGAAVVADAMLEAWWGQKSKCEDTLMSVSTMHLSGNRLGDTGTAHIASGLIAVSSLTFLDLRSNSIGDAGAKSLAKAIVGCKKLASLDLWFNMSIRQEGSDSLAYAVEENPSITWLRVDHDNQRLASALNRNRSRCMVLSANVQGESVSFLSLAGREILAIDTLADELTMKDVGERLAAVTDVGILRLRLLIADGRLATFADDVRSLKEVLQPI